MEFVEIRNFSSYIDAHLIQGRLEQENIHCWLKDVNFASLWGSAVSGIKLMVPEVQVKRAEEILSRWELERKTRYSCPHCGSHEVELITAVGIEEKEVYMCFNCGAEFDNPIDNSPTE